MKDLKRILIAATLLLSLVGGAGQASADSGKGGVTVTSTATWESAGVYLSAGITWE